MNICIIGSGPAGMVLALEFANTGFEVTLIESGSHKNNSNSQKLSEAHLEPNSTHSLMNDAVSRQFGGTSNLWGGRCVPYDEIDFYNRSEVGVLGWPFSKDELDKYWDKACFYANCGKAEFLRTEAIPGSSSLTESFVDSTIRSDQLERWSSNPVLITQLGQGLSTHPNIRCMLGWTAKNFSRNKSDRVDGVFVCKTDVKKANNVEELLIKTDLVIVACGGVESTRLLLNALESKRINVDGYKHLGRYYMGHLSGKIATINFNGDPKKTDYSFHLSNGFYVRRRITFTKDELIDKKILNIAFWLDNPIINNPRHKSGILSSAYLAMVLPIIGKRLAPKAIRNALIGNTLSISIVWHHIINVFTQLPLAIRFSVNFIWKRYFKSPRIPGFFVFSPTNTYALHFHSEQSSNWNSRISLIDDEDAIGMKRAKISLLYQQRDAESIVRAHELLDKHLQVNHIGSLEYWYPKKDLTEVVLSQAKDGFHQIGTIRMALSSKDGVTDEFGRVYGMENLYVCSSAVFPTSGQANPTLTILAFALRQVDHIKKIANLQ